MVVEAPKKEVLRRGAKMILAHQKHSKEVLMFLFISSLGLWRCQFSVVMAGTMIFITR
jgi:hypothetical protein